MNDDLRASCERLLDPAVLRETLISAAIFVLSFENFRETIVERLRTFFSEGWNREGPVPGEKYKREISFRNKNVLRASLNWHLDQGIIDDADLDKVDAARKYRNKLAHKMFKWASEEGLTAELATQLGEIIVVLDKIETWWIQNFELAINEDFDAVEVDPEDIVPGPVMALRMMLDVASGSTEYIDEFKRRFGAAQQTDAADGPSGRR